MKAGAAKSRPEWRSRRETHEGRSSQEKARMEITKKDEGRQMKAGAAKSRPEWRSRRGTNEGGLGGSGWQRQGVWGSATQSLGSKNPIASSYLGNDVFFLKYIFDNLLN